MNQKLFNKIYSTVIIVATIIGVNLLLTETALAWFRVCNKSSHTISLAFAYLDIPDSREYCDIFGCTPLPRNRKVWNSTGWWNLHSGECVNTYPHELRKRNNYYYVYAKSTNGELVWRGNHQFCVMSSRFGLAKANQVCGAGQTRWENFIQIYTGNARNFTYTLTN